jgi:flagellar export protein FliJ
MKKFQFRLQAVRSWRERQERAAIEAYAASLRNLRQVDLRVAAACAEQEKNRAAWRQIMKSGCPALDLLHYQQHDMVLEGRRITCLRERVIADRQVQTALAAMLAARQKRELVDKLETRLRQRHDMEAARQAQAEIDDMANSRRTGMAGLAVA